MEFSAVARDVVESELRFSLHEPEMRRFAPEWWKFDCNCVYFCFFFHFEFSRIRS